jgi:hypothetical protein
MTPETMLSRLRNSRLPLAFDSNQEVDAIRKLLGLGLIKAVISKPSKGRSSYGELQAVVLSIRKENH